MVTGPGQGQEILGDRPSDRFMTERDLPIDLDHEAVLDGFLQTGPQVGIDDPVAVTRPADRTRRGAIGPGLESGGHGRQCLAGERPLGEGEQPGDAPALGRPDGHPGDHEFVERAGQRGAGEFSSGGQQLLCDERQTVRPLRDEEQQTGRGALALDALDEGRQLIAIQRRETQTVRWTRAGDDRREI